MPNHVTNRIEFKGDAKIIENLLESLRGTEYPIWIDFNKIVPMPEGLDITCDGMVSLLDNQFMVSLPITHLIERIKKADTETIENFCKAIKNLNKYGKVSWHDWAITNWGTKWNAYNTKKVAPNIIEFDTAWAGVPNLIAKISEQFPQLEIEYKYADEDLGYNVGYIVFKNGNVDMEYYPEGGSNGAYQLALELKPYANEYVKLVDGEYKYVEEA